MASVNKETRNGRTLYSIRYRDGSKRRRRIRLGNVNAKDADRIRSKVEALASAMIANTAPDTATSKWVDGLGQELHDKLSAQGLVQPRYSATLRHSSPITLQVAKTLASGPATTGAELETT